MKSKISKLIIICLAFTSISCSTNSSNKNKSKGNKSKIPRVPARTMPGGNSDNWRYLGLSKDGVVGTEINDSSINQIDNNRYSFQERKTIMDTSKYQYPLNNPKYIYSISTWQVNCTAKSYIIKSTALYDKLGKQIKEPTQLYSSNESPIKNGSISEQEYNYICRGIGRSIGY